MNSLLLHFAARVFALPLLGLSIWFLYRGHNLPGGGFIGGLFAAGAFLLHDLSGYGRPRRGILAIPASVFLPLGLGIAVLSSLPGLLGAKTTFMQGLWLPAFQLPLLGTLHLGTPLIFDIGVYLTVIGFILLLAETLSKDNTP